MACTTPPYTPPPPRESKPNDPFVKKLPMLSPSFISFMYFIEITQLHNNGIDCKILKFVKPVHFKTSNVDSFHLLKDTCMYVKKYWQLLSSNLSRFKFWIFMTCSLIIN